jgi:hypothetical protein
MEHQDQAIMVRHAILGGVQVTGQYVRLVDSIIGEKAIGRLGIGPILADQRNALPIAPPNCANNLRKQRHHDHTADPGVPERDGDAAARVALGRTRSCP